MLKRRVEAFLTGLSDVGAQLLVKTLEGLEAGTITPVKQDDSESTYVKMLHKSFGKMDFNKSAAELERLIRGLNPWLAHLLI